MVAAVIQPFASHGATAVKTTPETKSPRCCGATVSALAAKGPAVADIATSAGRIRISARWPDVSGRHQLAVGEQTQEISAQMARSRHSGSGNRRGDAHRLRQPLAVVRGVNSPLACQAFSLAADNALSFRVYVHRRSLGPDDKPVSCAPFCGQRLSPSAANHLYIRLLLAVARGAAEHDIRRGPLCRVAAGALPGLRSVSAVNYRLCD